jgi:polyisoprenoid-binding protein YceI
MTKLRRYRFLFTALCIVVLGCAATGFAQEMEVQLDPAQTRVDFVLGDVLHTVHGDFRLKNGVLRFDPQNGGASGQLTVDATTGESGSDGRDPKMHKQVLESATYSDIIFQPQHVLGTLNPTGSSVMEIEGLMTMHGQTHPMTASGPVQVNGDQVTAELRFVVPYQQWGMKNPSTLFLRVSDKVEITVHAVGHLTPTVASAAKAGQSSR